VTSAANEETRQPAELLAFRRMEKFAESSPGPRNSDAVAEVEAEPKGEVVDVESSLRAAHEQGRSEAMAVAERELQLRLEQERDVLNRIAQQFVQEKRRYFSDVEAEVVKLSLAIAERILRREAEMDPLLLTAAAHVALEQVADKSEAVLCVAPDDLGRWNETFKPAVRGIVIVTDEAIMQGEAMLKTRSGTVHLGVRAQLQEIERGFFELLNRNPTLAA
jgi:flagellar assembly protein FliH